MDFGFILDSSGSVGQHNFERMKLFVKDLTDFYKLGSEETRVSVMSFSDSANIHIAFSAYFSDKDRFDSAVDRIQYNDGGTATGMALNMAHNDMFTSRNGARGSGKDIELWVRTCSYELPAFQFFILVVPGPCSCERQAAHLSDIISQ